MIYRKKKNIIELKEGEEIEDIFVVKIKKRFFDYFNMGKKYGFELLLSDSSGKTITYKMWGNEIESLVKKIYDSISEDSVVWLRGKVNAHKNNLEIYSNSLQDFRILSENEYVKEDFINPPVRDIDEMMEILMENINLIKDEEIKEFLLKLFQNPEFSEKFKRHPAAIEIHHNRIGGLIEHTLEIIEIVKTLKRLYPSLNLDLMISGAILHDIGKLEEIEVTNRIKGSFKGQLIGHISLGLNFISKKMEEFGMSENKRILLMHLLLSHHGSNSFGSPKEPMIPEAFALYYSDELSSKISEIINFIEITKKATDDVFMYHKKYKRNIYLGRD